MRVLLFLIVFLISKPVFGEIQKVSLPLEVRAEVSTPIDDEIRGKVWNRWVSDNFVVCCLDDAKARYLYNNLEDVKKWVLGRWGLKDVKFTAECILLGVDDPQFFKKIFGVENSKVEIRRDSNGDINRSVIFLLLDDLPSRTVPEPLTEVCLSEYEQVNHVKFGWWAHRGVSLLNGTLPSIRRNIAELKPLFQRDAKIYFGKALFEMDESFWNKESEENKHLFDINSMCLCLMLRKEFGQKRFLKILNSTDYAQTIIRDFRFMSLDEFDSNFKRFMFDLSNDVSRGAVDKPITPDSYLQIKAQK